MSLAALAATGLGMSCSLESIVEYYRVMNIDSKTLKVSFSSPIWFGSLRGIQGEYYESRINVSIEPHRRTVTHVETGGASSAPIVDLLMIQADGTLIYRDKRQVVARLQDVTVLAQTDYFYADEYRQAPPDVLVNVDTDLGWQVPGEAQALPVSPPPTLTGAALVRILNQTDGSVIVGSANYGLNGRVKALNTRSLHHGRVDDSTVTFFVNGQLFGNSTSLVDQPANRSALGFPAQFSISEYLGERRLPASLTAVPSVTDLVLIEYNFNEWMQRDQYAFGKLASTRILHVNELKEDRMLAPIDRRDWKH